MCIYFIQKKKNFKNAIISKRIKERTKSKKIFKHEANISHLDFFVETCTEVQFINMNICVKFQLLIILPHRTMRFLTRKAKIKSLLLFGNGNDFTPERTFYDEKKNKIRMKCSLTGRANQVIK